MINPQQLLLLIFASASVAAQSLILPTTSGDGAAGDNLGYAIAHCGFDTFATALGDQRGRPDSSNGQVVGSVYRLRYLGDQPEIVEKLQPLIPDDEAFGVSVACAAQGLFVGAVNAGDESIANAGKVRYFYQVNGVWTPQADVLPALSAVDARFGAALAANASWLAVTASGLSRVYLFARSGPSLTFNRSIDSPIGSSAGFGNALMLDGESLWIGAPTSSASAGTAYRYSVSTGLQTAALSGPAGFGASFASSISQGRLWIGAPSAAGGAVLSFDANLNPLQTLSAATLASPPEGFGSALATLGQALVIGAPLTSFGTQRFVGSAFHYQINAGNAVLVQRIDPPINSAAGVSNTGLFGAGLAFNESGALILSASQVNGPSLPLQGQIYSFRLGSGTGLLSASTGRGLSYERIGQTISADAQTMVSGSAFAPSIYGPETGRVYVFRPQRDSWQFAQTLEPPDIEVEQRFGSAVAVQGDYIVVGSIWNVINNKFDAGSGYVFKRVNSRFEFLQKLTAATPGEGALFGSAVAIDQDWLAIGARAARSPDFDQGRVSLFQRQSNGHYMLRQTLAPPGTVAFDLFGASLAMESGSLLIGAPGARRAGSAAGGRAYHYTLQSGVWSLQNELLDALGSGGAGFGLSVALSNNGHMLVSAPLQSIETQSAAGVVLRFDTAGTLMRRQTAPTLQAGTLFGIALAMRGAETVIGASGLDSETLLDAGVAYYYASASDTAQVLSLPNAGLASLGRSAALPNGRLDILIGAPGIFRSNPQEGGIFSIAAPINSADLFSDGFEALSR